ncbi:MAG: CvpA family protein [Muribaculaceae bacterium]|nr:CvpA family protein [Muribaculaceae bacterium]
MNIAYHIIVLIVAGIALMRGWKLGLIRQIGRVLGICVGSLAAHVFYEPAYNFFLELHIWPVDNVVATFAASLLGCSAIYAITYLLLNTLGRVFSSAMSVIGSGAIDSLFGCVACLTGYLIALSIAFNFLLACNPDSPLMKYSCDDDGNIVEGVMAIAPLVLGCESYVELAHRIQLREAKKISCNYPARADVMSMDEFLPVATSVA